MSRPSTFSNVERAIVARIAALDGSPYTHGKPPAVWHESDTPLSVISDPSSLGHLSFGVWIQAAPNTYDARSATFQDAGWLGDPDGVDPDNLAEIDARVRVAFCFEIRNPNGTADARQATDAALDVVRGLMAPWSAADEAEWGTVTVRLVDGLQTSVSLDGHWLLIQQDYIATFDIDLLP